MEAHPTASGEGAGPILVFREPADDAERRAALRLAAAEGVPPAGRLFVLAELGADNASFPRAAVIVERRGSVWRLGRVRALREDHPRLAEELIRVATTIGVRQLISSPPPDARGGAILRSGPMPAVVRDGWVLVDL
jgi:hypothetical protein